MQRVMIVGQPGSGKSTLARSLGEATGLPVVHIDMIHWSPGWIERSQAEKSAMCAEVHARETWIFEGGHSSSWKERLDRCDTLIWVDFPVGVRLWRVFRRTLQYYGRPRPDLPEGCPERFNAEFLIWIWSTRNTNRDRIKQLIASAPPEKDVIILRSTDKINAYVEQAGRPFQH